ncbi:MAG TPA: glycerophosphodiester phosphodiesterase [Frankiaceae bacterium]|nr:glycerophosphodiester phosphodiesterase [Frankiaceae bacterium]
MKVYGHRGYAARHPHNSLAGVVAAFDAGADGVEVDVRRTAAGDLVLSNAPLGAGAAPDRLVDVLDAARGRVVCEVKNVPGEPDFDAPAEATAHLLVALLRDRPGADVTVSSFDWYAIDVARAAGLRTAFLTPPPVTLGAALAYVTGAGHAECHVHWSGVLDDAGSVALARDAGVEVVAWGVTEVETYAALRDAGVSGVIADDPAALLDDDR